MTSIRINLTTSEILKQMKVIHLVITGFISALLISQAAYAVSLDDISFSKLDGAPQDTGSIRLEVKPYEKNITINEKGTVSY